MIIFFDIFILLFNIPKLVESPSPPFGKGRIFLSHLRLEDSRLPRDKTSRYALEKKNGKMFMPYSVLNWKIQGTHALWISESPPLLYITTFKPNKVICMMHRLLNRIMSSKLPLHPLRCHYSPVRVKIVSKMSSATFETYKMISIMPLFINTA